MRVGGIVKCVEKPDYIHGITRMGKYVVVAIEQHYGHDYIKILGDDNRGHTFLSTMFRPVNKKGIKHGR